jgi:hypothetical protein
MNAARRRSRVKSKETPPQSAATEQSSDTYLVAALLPDLKQLPRNAEWEDTETRITAHTSSHLARLPCRCFRTSNRVSCSSGSRHQTQ